MEQRSDALPDRQTDNSASAWAELVVHNGRLSGTRKVLSAPITTIGRAENCDLRLNAEAVGPFHCVLAYGPEGLILRNLEANHGTLVNGQEVTACSLREGDLLGIGPLQFQVHRVSAAVAAGGN